jgi:metal-responsive CopG/Arc/MetJ family transcriptional regulator
MENVSLKLETNIAKQIDKRMSEFNYSTKTEFIREAIRDKLSELSKESERKQAFQMLMKSRGVFKGEGKAKTDAEFRELRAKAGDDYLDQLEKQFNQK